MEFSSSVGSSHVEGWQVVPKNHIYVYIIYV